MLLASHNLREAWTPGHFFFVTTPLHACTVEGCPRICTQESDVYPRKGPDGGGQPGEGPRVHILREILCTHQASLPRQLARGGEDSEDRTAARRRD